MRTLPLPSFSAAVLIGVSLLGTSARADTPDAASTLTAPALDGWTVKSDVLESAKKTSPVEKKLGGKIKALRNTVYDVSGKKVQINTMQGADAAEADKLFAALSKTKPAWAVVRKGDVVYELVGKNSAMAEMKAAHDKLAGP